MVVSAPVLSLVLLPLMVSVPLTKAPSLGLLRVSTGRLEIGTATVTVLRAPWLSIAVSTMLWLPEPAVAALMLNRYRLLVEQNLEQALGSVSEVAVAPSKEPSTRAIPYCELALASILMVPVLAETEALRARLELATFRVRRTSV